MFNAETDQGNFKASLGWLEKFLNRHHFRLRVPTTICQKPPIEYARKLVEFVIYVSKLRQRQTYEFIYAADETAVWLDPSGEKCIDERGAREVSVLSTGHDKMRITVILTARSDGKKNLPYILLPKKRPVPLIVEKFKNKLLLSWAGKVWMDDSLTADYLQRVFGRSSFGKRLLVWDSFRCHISEATKNQLKILNLHTAVIPGGYTKFIQAPDVVCNGPFKAKLQQLYHTWMLNGAQKEWTASRNPRPASMEVYLEWICTAWESISKESIIKSFKDCGIKVCHDGSEDDLIHCFKQNGPVPEGRHMLKFARACILNEANEPAEADPEQDEENGYISDQSLDFETDVFLV